MERLEALLELSRAVNAAATLQDVFDRALAGLAESLHLDRCALLLFDPDGVLRFKAWRGLSEEYRARVEGHSPWPRDAVDPPPVVVSDARVDPSLAAYRDVIEREGIGALGFIPLLHRHELLGKFMVYFDQPHEFRREEVLFAETVANLIATVVDRERREAALRTSRDQLSGILRAVGDGITVQSTTGQLLYANEAAARMIGFDRVEDLLASPVAEFVKRFEIFDEEGRPLPLDRLPGRAALTGRESEVIVRSRVAATGEERWSIVSAAPVRDASGAVQFAVNVFRDISDMQRARARMSFVLKASKKLGESLDYVQTCSTLLELCVPELADYGVVYIVENDGEIRRTASIHSDPAKHELLDELERRYPVDPEAPTPLMRTLQMHVSELSPIIPPGFSARLARDARHLEILETLATRQYILVPLRAHGRTLGAMMLAVAESGRTYIEDDLLLVESVARRAALAIDNGRLYAEAQDANRAKDEFLATLSHELRTPMTAIMGWASMLRLADVDPATFRLALETIERSARVQSRIVEDILDMSKVVRGKFDIEKTPLELSAVVAEAVEGIRPEAAAKNIDVEVRATTLPMYGDAGRLKQVLWNLLTNAIKFTSSGGRIEVTAERSGKEATIRVRDSGQGMPPELLTKIFDRFQQGDASFNRIHGGLGLGLAIVRHIVDVHGGRVEAFSEGLGRGSTFTVWLPMLDTSERVASPAVDAYPQLDGCRVLIVHGQNDSRLLIESILTRCGAVTLSVDDVDSAMNACDSFGAHVVLSDTDDPSPARFGVPEIRVRSMPADPRELALTVAKSVRR